tara:strand:+ start:1085 stop:1747 length:663 start_codon:yes stop_codon:yes gene_type:complete
LDNNQYTIIIPIFNEVSSISKLLSALNPYYSDGHEIIIIDDGSTDGSHEILSKCNFIELISFNQNRGKGIAIREGLSRVKKDKIILFDGDLELHPTELKKLMILNNKKQIHCVFANRYSPYPSLTIWDIGNFVLNILFNLVNKTRVKDALCCAKSFFKSDIDLNNLRSSKFDIDVEISSQLVKTNQNIININVNYKRRDINQGKKLKMSDGLQILKRILY